MDVAGVTFGGHGHDYDCDYDHQASSGLPALAMMNLLCQATPARLVSSVASIPSGNGMPRRLRLGANDSKKDGLRAGRGDDRWREVRAGLGAAEPKGSGSVGRNCGGE